MNTCDIRAGGQRHEQELATLSSPEAPHAGTDGEDPPELAPRAVGVPLNQDPDVALTQPDVQPVGEPDATTQSVDVPAAGCCFVCTPSQL